ncbi:MAG: tetratricopeptide repeat protein, partial [Acidobacteriota bacterium]
AIKLDPHKGEAYNNLGSVLTKLARHSEAVEAFREAARLLPEVIDIEKNLANAYFQWERYPDAIKHLEKYLGSRPNDFSARHLLGLSLFLHGEVGRAIQTLEDLRSLGRKDMGVLYTLSVAYIRAGRFSEAQDVLASLFKAHSGSAESHLLLAQALEGQHKYREALDEVNRALELNPELALAHFYKGRIYWRQAKAEQAEAEFSRELQINPKHTDSFYFRGTVRFFEQRFDDAEADFRRALELDPQHFPARFHLARSLLKMNEYQAAAAHLKKTVQMDPTHSETYYLLGRALQKMGQAEEARKYLERARQLGDQKSRNLREEFSQAAKPH